MNVKFEIPRISNLSSSPDCYAIFFPFEERDTTLGADLTNVSSNISTTGAALPGIILGADPEGALLADTLIVQSDIKSCKVTKSKERGAGTFELSLMPGKDYKAILHQGDHVLLWMRRDRASSDPSKKFSHDFNSGFKLWGVVTSVRRTVITAPTGIKLVRYQVSGEDFGHFLETDVYYNSILAEKLKDQGALFYFLGMLTSNPNLIRDPGENVNGLLTAYLGKNLDKGPVGGTDEGAPNKAFRIPQQILDFFKTTPALTSSNFSPDYSGTVNGVLWRQIGVLHYQDGINPDPTRTPLAGIKFIQLDIGSKFSLWSTLLNYSNEMMNEMFCDIRPVSATKQLQPTFILRQIPYTSSQAKNSLDQQQISSTTFLELPRMRVHESLLLTEDTGKSEATRANYIQLFGHGPVKGGQVDTAIMDTLLGNYAIDTSSISRYGLRAMIRDTDNDIRGYKNTAALINQIAQSEDEIRSEGTIVPGPGRSFTLVPDWVRLYADWHLRAHLLEDGTFEFIGLQEPVGIGDNLEIVRDSGKNELHHVQTYTHAYQVDDEGHKTFRTVLSTVRGQFVDETPLSSKPNLPLFSNTVDI